MEDGLTSTLPRTATGGERPATERNVRQEFTLYVLAGTAATGLHALLFLLLRDLIGAYVGNVLAILVTAAANVEFHRLVTFRGKEGTVFRRLVAIAGTVAYDASYSTAGLLLLTVFVADPTATQQTATIVIAAAIGGLLRFILLRTWVFRRSRAGRAGA